MDREERDARFTRFLELHKNLLARKQSTYGFGKIVGINYKPTKFRRLFDYSSDTNTLPSKLTILDAVEIIGFALFLEEIENHVVDSFAAARELLEIEQHDSEMLQEPQPKAKPGRKADPKIQLRREIVRKHIQQANDFHDKDKKQALLKELQESNIPLLKDAEGMQKHNRISKWPDYMRKSHLWEQAVEDVLKRDVYDRKAKSHDEITTKPTP